LSILTEQLLLATNNQAKVREYLSLLRDLPYQLVTLAEQGITTAVSEDGETLEENASIKAKAFAAESQLLAMADDSGLEVDALGGEPRSGLPVSGVLSPSLPLMGKWN